MKKLIFPLALLAATATSAPAAEMRTALEAFLRNNVTPWASDPSIVVPVMQQNARTAGLGAARIAELDALWQDEVGSAATPMIDAVVNSPSGDFLRGRLEASGGAITEIFVMDAAGLNVAASGVTSDYWQGDEAKFQQTYPLGPDAVHFSEVEYDESTQIYHAQISLTLTDPETGDPIGAMTVGVDADALF